MSPIRAPWKRVALITLISVCVLGLVFAVTATKKVADAEDVAADLDGLFSLAAVAQLEGALHEEGTLAMAYRIGLIESEELEELVVATGAAHDELLDEITYYDAGDPIGAALIAIDDSLGALPAHREALLAGTLEGSVAQPYRTSLDLTAAAVEPISVRLVAPPSGKVTNLALDEARRASSDAVMFATAVIADGGNREDVAAALVRVDSADATLRTQAPPTLVDSLSAAGAEPDVIAARDGVELIAAGEAPDLFVWADVAAEWPIAYGDAQEPEIETGLALLESRATSAEDAAVRYLVVGGAASLLAVAFTALVARRFAVRRPSELTEPVGAAPTAA